MIDRRTFVSLLATAAGLPKASWAQARAAKVALYASVGPELTHYDVDVEAATLTRRGTVTLPANVHYCWPHASRPILYAASSDSAPGSAAGSNHHVTALAIDRHRARCRGSASRSRCRPGRST